MSSGAVLPLAAIAYAVGIGAAGALEALDGKRVGSMLWFIATLCVGVLTLTSKRWGAPHPRHRRMLAMLCLACLGGCNMDLQWEVWLRHARTLEAMSAIEVYGALQGEPGNWRIQPKRICVAEASPDNCISGRSLPALWWKNGAGIFLREPTEAGVIWAKGRYVAPQRPKNPGEHDALAYAVQAGAAGELRVTAWRQESITRDILAQTRQLWKSAIRSAVPGEAGLLLQEMILGGSGELAPAVRQALNRSGLAHVTSVSGLHVALVAGFLWLLCGGRAGWRGWAGVLAGGLFVLLSGGRPPAMRALIGLVVTVAAGSHGRRADPWLGLAAAWLGLLILNPALLTNIGFGLSFASVAGILGVARPLLRTPARGDQAFERARIYAQNSLAVSLGAQAGAGYISAQTFGMVPALGCVANLAGIPLATAALLIGLSGVVCRSCAAWLGVGLGAWLECAGTGLLQAAGWCASAFLWLCEIIAGAPWSSVEVPVLPPLAGMAWVCGLCALSLWLQRRQLPCVVRRARGPEHVWLCLALAGVSGCLALTAPALWQMRVTFLAVGQGDAILIQTPAGAILVDAGGAGQGWDASRIIVPQLRRRGIRRLALAISTHPHADHLGGMAGVIRSRRVGSVVDTGVIYASKAFREYHAALLEKSVPRYVVKAGDTLTLGGVKLEVLWPPAQYANRAGADANAGSIVLRASYGKVAVLLMGDVTVEAQTKMLQMGAPVQAVLWKASHQGALSSFNPDFVSAVAPQVSVISVGANQYGHPSPVVVSELQKQSEVCRTDTDGAVEFVTNGNHWRVRGMRSKDCLMSGVASGKHY